MTLIRQLRKSQGLSVIELARKSRVNPSILSEVERRRRAVSSNARRALAKFHKVPESAIFDSEGFALEEGKTA
ncbi:MAG: helix-turn-helix domain-containing protein [Synergistaceae bacterium]|nr:helix-turn-helix domain-containing protein [Synergistaceae bacterium]